MCPNFQRKQKTLTFGPKLAQKWILWSELEKSKSGFGIRTCKIPDVPIFSQNGQLWIFRPKFGEIAQLRAISWFKYCWGCCRELLGGWNELVGGWNGLGGGGWSRMEVDGTGWRWVHSLVIPNKNWRHIVSTISNNTKQANALFSLWSLEKFG